MWSVAQSYGRGDWWFERGMRVMGMAERRLSAQLKLWALRNAV